MRLLVLLALLAILPGIAMAQKDSKPMLVIMECAEWSECVNSRQTQACTYDGYIKYNMRNCTQVGEGNYSAALLAGREKKAELQSARMERRPAVQAETRVAAGVGFGMVGTGLIVLSSFSLFKFYKKRSSQDFEMPLIKP